MHNQLFERRKRSITLKRSHRPCIWFDGGRCSGSSATPSQAVSCNSIIKARNVTAFSIPMTSDHFVIWLLPSARLRP